MTRISGSPVSLDLFLVLVSWRRVHTTCIQTLQASVNCVRWKGCFRLIMLSLALEFWGYLRKFTGFWYSLKLLLLFFFYFFLLSFHLFHLWLLSISASIFKTTIFGGWGFEFHIPVTALAARSSRHYTQHQNEQRMRMDQLDEAVSCW